MHLIRENGFKQRANEISLGLEYALVDQMNSKKSNTSAYVSEQTFDRYEPYFRIAALQINADVDDWFDNSQSEIITYVGSSSVSPMRGVGFTRQTCSYFAAINFENHGEQTTELMTIIRT